MLSKESTLFMLLAVGCIVVSTAYASPMLTNYGLQQATNENLPLRMSNAGIDSAVGDNSEWWHNKRSGTSLSIVNPIEVLRSRFMMEMARRKIQQQDEGQRVANEKLLKAIGKRALDRAYYNGGSLGAYAPSGDRFPYADPLLPAWNTQ